MRDDEKRVADETVDLHVKNPHEIYILFPHLEDELIEYLQRGRGNRSNLSQQLYQHLARFQTLGNDFKALKQAIEKEADDLRGVDFRDLELMGLNLQEAKCYGANFSNADLSHANLNHADLRECQFTSATCYDAIFVGADCRNARFSKADLFRAALQRSQLENARFQDALCQEARFIDVRASKASFRHAGLTASNFMDADLTNADLSYASCERTVFVGADFENTNVHKTRFRKVSTKRSIKRFEALKVRAKESRDWPQSASGSGSRATRLKHRVLSWRMKNADLSAVKRIVSWWGFTRFSSIADIRDSRNIDEAKSPTSAYWPGPFAIVRTHNSHYHSMPKKVLLRVLAVAATAATGTILFMLRRNFLV